MSSCDIDYDRPEFMTAKYITARKQHKCCECGCQIQAGSLYEYVAGKWDGDFQTIKTCERCADLRDSLAHDGCYVYGELKENYWETIVNVLPSHEAAETQFDRVFKSK